MVHLASIFSLERLPAARETNWVIGSLLLILAMFEAISATHCLRRPGLRAAPSSITPVCRQSGPGCTGRRLAVTSRHHLIPRLYARTFTVADHLGADRAHLALVCPQKHTQLPGPGSHRSTTSLCVRVMPVFAFKSGAFFAAIVGVLGLMRPAADQPDLESSPTSHLGVGGLAARLLHDVTEGLARSGRRGVLLLASITPRPGLGRDHGLVFVLLPAYPFLEKRFTGDYAHHNLLQRAFTGRSGAHRDRRHG